MRRLFIQFYLLLMASFVVAVLLIGSLYEGTAERVGNRYLEYLVQDSLDRLSQELAQMPADQWSAHMTQYAKHLGMALHTAPLSAQPLEAEDLAFLAAGNIVLMEADDTFIQRIGQSDRVLVVGPVPYLSFLHQLRWVDVGLLLGLGLSLGLPILWWLRPHWRGLQQLVATAQRLGAGDLQARVSLPVGSSLAELGQTFDQMAERLQASIAGRKLLTDAMAHELRTPLGRLRYRLAMLASPLSDSEERAIGRDLATLEHLIDDMLTYGRLTQPGFRLTPGDWELVAWARGHLTEWQALGPQCRLSLVCDLAVLPWRGDLALLERAMDNLVANALRHARQQVQVRLQCQDEQIWLSVADDGPRGARRGGRAGIRALLAAG